MHCRYPNNYMYTAKLTFLSKQIKCAFFNMQSQKVVNVQKTGDIASTRKKLPSIKVRPTTTLTLTYHHHTYISNAPITLLDKNIGAVQSSQNSLSVAGIRRHHHHTYISNAPITLLDKNIGAVQYRPMTFTFIPLVTLFIL